MALGSAIDLALKITVDGDERAKNAIQSLRKTYDAETKAIEGSGKNALLSLGNAAGLSTKEMAALGAVLPLVGAGIVAIGGAAAATAAGIFYLAKSTSDFGSQIFDASQKTGLATETISALGFEAGQSGSSMEEMNQAVVKFSRLIGDAAKGSKEATETLIRLGLDPKKAINDLEGSLAQVFKTINDAEEDIEKTALATDAFGRSGANIIPIIKSVDGDLAGLIKRARELGVTFSEEDARAADEFGDTLDTLKAQFAALGYTIGREVMPEITGGMQKLSVSLAENRGAIKAWVQDLEAAVSALVSVGGYIQGLIGFLSPMTGVLGGIAEQLARIRNMTREIVPGIVDAARLGAVPTADPWSSSALVIRDKKPSRLTPSGGGGGGGKGGGGGADPAKEAQRRELEQLQIYNKDLQIVTRANSEILEREYDRRLISLEDYYAQAQADADTHYQGQLDGLTREEEIARKYTKSQEDLALKLKDINLRRKEAEDKRAAEQVALEDERRDAMHKAQIAHMEALYDLHETYRNAEREQVARDLDYQVISEAEGIARLMEIEDASYAERRRRLVAEVELAGQNVEARQKALDALALGDAEYTTGHERNVQRRIDASMREHGPLEPTGSPYESTIEQQRGNVLSNQDLAELGPPPNMDPWLVAFETLKQKGGEAFKSITQGAGQLFAQFVMGEKITVKAFLGMLKGVAASLAGQAGAEALMQGAHALKEYALAAAAAANPFTAWLAPGHILAAKAHLVAAAAYGAVSLGAAGAALLIPGGGSGSSAGATAGAGGGSAAGSYTPTVGTPVVEERGSARAAAAQPLRGEITVKLGLDPVGVLKVLSDDIENDGDMRTLILALNSARR